MPNVRPAAIAAEGKDLKSLHLLHDAGATLAFPPIHGKSSLHIYASLGDNFTLLCQFLRENPRFVSTSLGIAIKLKDPAMLELMFSLGLGVNQVEGPAQRSILHRVIDSGSMKLVEKVLAQQSVEINARDAHGWTPLHVRIEDRPIIC
jgi:ankyrin repeat protein